MKHIILIAFLGVSSVAFAQFGMLNSPTWLYNLSKTETYTIEWGVPYGYQQGNINYSIYYAKDGNWKFVGSILTTGATFNAKLYFKSGYRVAYGKEDEKPIEIILESKEWKVE